MPAVPRHRAYADGKPTALACRNRTDSVSPARAKPVRAYRARLAPAYQTPAASAMANQARGSVSDWLVMDLPGLAKASDWPAMDSQEMAKASDWLVTD